MEKNVLITVNSKIDDLQGEPDKMSFITEGTFSKANNEYTVSYQESEITGLNGTTTILKVQPDSVTLIRHGNVSSMMLFEVGKTHLTDYATEYGSVMLGVTAKKVEVSIDDHGGDISVDYILEYNRAYGGRNTINVKIQEKKN